MIRTIEQNKIHLTKWQLQQSEFKECCTYQTKSKPLIVNVINKKEQNQTKK